MADRHRRQPVVSELGPDSISLTGLRPKAERLLKVLERDPFETPPPHEKLRGDLAGAYSRRINIQRRLVYQVLPAAKTVKVLRMWTHYE